MRPIAPLARALAALLLGATAARAEPPAEGGPPDASPAPEPAHTRFRLELKLQATDRASPGESSRTTLRGEVRPGEGPLALLRVDVPWVNKNNDFDSDPTWVGLGDVVVKASARALRSGEARATFFLEVRLPTAANAKLGGGKVVLIPGLTVERPLPWRTGGRPVWISAEPTVDVSVAGDADRADVGYAVLELKAVTPLATVWALEWVVKPSVDWVKDGTAGVAELTGEWTPGDWRLGLKLGRRLWGGAVGGSYDTKVELAVRRTF